MTMHEYSLLICTNGAAEGLHVLDYGLWLAEQLQVPVTLLGVTEAPARRPAVEQALQAAQARLEAAGVAHAVWLRTGLVREVLCAETAPDKHLVVLGPQGQPAWERWLRGSSFRRVIPNLHAPFIYVPAAHCQMSRILLCTGALGYAAAAESWALHLARRTGAALTVLHVAEAVHLHYPTAEEMDRHWQDLLATDLPQARNLRALLAQAKDRGVEAALQVRHGTVVHEIIAAARAGRYDLLVMGSKYSSHSLRRQFLPDVTAETMEASKVPVLAVRSGGRHAVEAGGGTEQGAQPKPACDGD